MNNSFELKENVDLAPLTTLRIGGRARYFVRAETEEAIVKAFDFAARNHLPAFVLGGGSNVLIADEGFDGVVVHVSLRGIETETRNDSTVDLTAKAGEDWDDLVRYCVERGLAGVECLSGIPGSVGGTPVQNVGAYGQEVSETIVSVRCFDRRSGAFVTLTNGQCGFSYRTSILNTTDRDRYVVLSVTFRLKPGGKPKLVYKDLCEFFEDGQPSLAEVREAVLKIRRTKSMVIDPDDPNSVSAGSFFKNPIVPVEIYNGLVSKLGSVPSFPFDGNRVKVPAAWLIERAGFKKGFELGRAGLSANHTLAVINRGGASAAEVLLLKTAIQEAVKSEFGLELQTEPVFVGFS